MGDTDSFGGNLLTGGAGVDTYNLNGCNCNGAFDEVTDFTAGSGGDVIGIQNVINTIGFGTDNPFAGGYLRLADDGFGNTLVQIDRQGFNDVNETGLVTVLKLDNVDPDDLVGSNFDPAFSPDLGDETFAGGDGDNSHEGIAGSDTILGNGGNDTLLGLTGNNSIDGGTGNNSLSAGSGDDTVDGNIGNDTIDGGTGNNSLEGASGSGDDSIVGGVGNDTLVVGAGGGNDTLIGGDGNDLLDASGSVGTGSSLDGGNNNDTLIGSSGSDTLQGGAGDNSISAGAGNDTIDAAQSGLDTIVGGGDNDVFNNVSYYSDLGADLLTGGSGVDTYFLSPWDAGGACCNAIAPDAITDFAPGAGGDVIDITAVKTLFQSITGADPSFNAFAEGWLRLFDDGLGNTFIQANMNTLGVSNSWATILQLNGVAPNQLTSSNFNPPNASTITGSAAGETHIGTTGNDTIDALGGNDSIDGARGSDSILGGTGNDTINAGTDPGDDTIDAGSGDDVFNNVSYYAAGGNNLLTGGTGFDLYHVTPWGSCASQHCGSAFGADAVMDFTGGVGGDVIDLAELIKSFNSGYGLGNRDPFDAGFLQLVSDGLGNVLLQTNYDSPNSYGATQSWQNLLVLKNVNLSDITAANFLQTLNIPSATTPRNFIGANAAENLRARSSTTRSTARVAMTRFTARAATIPCRAAKAATYSSVATATTR